MSKFIVYALIEPDTKEVRYIGKSTSGLDRPRGHLKPSKYLKEKNYKANWIKSVMEKGLKPEIIILSEANKKEDLTNLEMFYIKKYREEGARLTNLTDGGEGAPGRLASEETKQKISMALKKAYAPKIGHIINYNRKHHININGTPIKSA